MKKKFFLILFVFLLASPVFSEPAINNPLMADNSRPLEASISFDWISKTQMQRDESIKQIQDLLFTDDIVAKYSKKDFKTKYKPFLKEKDYMTLYEQISNGIKEDETRNYCGFYVGKLLIAYGIQYKNNPKNVYYYDAMGSLRWVDVFSSNYPKFPYWSYQYYKTGEMTAAYYYISEYDQYVFDPDKKFRGRWYKDKFYNRKAKVVMTRSNW